MSEEPTLEAVTIDPKRQTISVATLGRSDLDRLASEFRTKLLKAQEAGTGTACGLLTGSGNCLTCQTPLSDEERQRVTIKQEVGATTIARVTCPTAPRFWRWREFPFPKVVQRDVEFVEHEHADPEEWKSQLMGAALCGGFGLAGYFLERTGHSWEAITVFLAKAGKQGLAFPCRQRCEISASQ